MARTDAGIRSLELRANRALDAYLKGLISSKQLLEAHRSGYELLEGVNPVANTLQPKASKQDMRSTYSRLTDRDKQEIVRMYESGASTQEVARAFGCRDNTVLNCVKRAGVAVRKRPRESYQAKRFREDGDDARAKLKIASEKLKRRLETASSDD